MAVPTRPFQERIGLRLLGARSRANKQPSIGLYIIIGLDAERVKGKPRAHDPSSHQAKSEIPITGRLDVVNCVFVCIYLCSHLTMSVQRYPCRVHSPYAGGVSTSTSILTTRSPPTPIPKQSKTARPTHRAVRLSKPERQENNSK
jgi:hypothetical protein